MKNFTIKTQGTCARQIEFGLENGRLHHIHFPFDIFKLSCVLVV